MRGLFCCYHAWHLLMCRYKLVSASAESWFDDPNGTRDQQINSPLEIYFIYGGLGNSGQRGFDCDRRKA